MIKSIELKGFQSHLHSMVSFGPGVNTILGHSNHGKSAILKAVQWLKNNRPSTDSFIHDDVSQASVRAVVDRGVVYRERSRKSTGVYEAGGEEFNTFGTSVPEPVLSMLNLTDLNIQDQGENHFLIRDTAGQVARTLNDITKLDVLANGLSRLKKRKLAKQQDATIAKDSRDAAIAFLASEDVVHIRALPTRLKTLAILDARVTELSSKNFEVFNVLVGLEDVGKTLQKMEGLEGVEGEFEEVRGLINKYRKISTKFNSVRMAVDSIREVAQDKVQILEVIKTLEGGRADILEKLKQCPYCHSKLDDKHRNILIGEPNG